MAEDKLGRFMKDKVLHYPSPTDAEALWQKIHSAQKADKSNRRKGLFWIWGSGLALVLILGLLAKPFLLNSDQSNVSNASILKTTDSNTPVANETKAIDQSDKKLEQNAFSTLSLSATTSNKNNKPVASSQTLSNDFTPAAIAQKNEETKQQKLNEKITSKQNHNFNLPVNEKLVSQTAPILKQNIPTENKALAPTTINTKETKAKKEIARYMPLPILAMKTFSNKHFPKLKPGAWYEKPSPPRRGNYFNYSIGASVLYGSSLKTLSAKSEASKSFQKLRETSETKLEVFGGNLDFRMEHSSGLYGKIGVEYEQINERFDFDVFEEKVYIDDNQLLKIIYDVNGVPTEIYGPGEVTETFTYKKKVYNSYRMFDVPLMLGYRFGYEDFGFFIESGVAMNVLFSPEGELFAAEDEPIKLADKKGDIFKTNLGVSILGGIGFSYQMTDQIGVYLSPRLKYRPSSITIEDYPLEQKYFNTAVQIGMRYQWSD